MKTRKKFIGDNKPLQQIALVTLVLSCIFSNLFYFLNFPVFGFIMDFRRICLLIVAVYCCILWIMRLHKKSAGAHLKKAHLRMFAFLFFVFLALCGVVWILAGRRDRVAISEAAYLIMLAGYAFCLFTLIQDASDVEICCKTVALSALILAVLGTVEVVTGPYLPADEAIQDGVEAEKKLRLYAPTTVFTNTNDLCAILFLSLSVMLDRILCADSIKKVLLRCTAVIVIFIPITFTSSTIFKIGFTVVLAMFILLVLLRKETKQGKLRGIGVTVGTEAMSLYATRLWGPLAYTIKMVSCGVKPGQSTFDPGIVGIDSLADQVNAFTQGGGTIYIRAYLAYAGVLFFLDRPLLGYGPHGFQILMQQANNSYLRSKTGGIVDPHNFLIELLVQYGLVFFVPFIVLCAVVLVRAFRLVRKGETLPKRRTASLTVLLMVACAFVSIMPSSLIRLSPVWVFFLLSIANIEIIENESNNLMGQ